MWTLLFPPLSSSAWSFQWPLFSLSLSTLGSVRVCRRGRRKQKESETHAPPATPARASERASGRGAEGKQQNLFFIISVVISTPSLLCWSAILNDAALRHSIYNLLVQLLSPCAAGCCVIISCCGPPSF